jgi:hypothetical protein
MASDAKADASGDSAQGPKSALAAGAEALESAAKAVSTVGKALGALQSKSGSEQQDGGSPNRDTSGERDVERVAALAGKAAARYRTTMTWVVSALSSVAAVAFASLPFVIGETGWLGFVGLGVAVVGVSAVIYAKSRVDEPVVASLGDVLAEHAQLQRWYRSSESDYAFMDLEKMWWRWRTKAVWGYFEILDGEDGRNHLGPAWQSERSLSQCLVELAHGNWRAHDHRRAVSAEAAGAEVTYNAARRQLEDLRSSTDRTWSRYQDALRVHMSAAGVGQSAGPSQRDHPVLNGLWMAHETAWEDENDAASRWMGAAARRRKHKERLAANDLMIAEYLQHREFLLWQFALAGLRSVFRMARVLVFVGVLLVAVGVLVYASQIGAAEPTTPAATMQEE